MSDQNALVVAAKQVLTQGQALLAAVDAKSYTFKPIADSSSASIGDHYRHILDHFSCLLDGLADRRIDYDARQRDSRIADDPAYAAWLTDQLLGQFQALSSAILAEPVEVSYSVGYCESEPDVLRSTVGREIAFAVGHAVHHFAIVRLLAEQSGAQLPANFGFAPSTLNHLASAGILAGVQATHF